MTSKIGLALVVLALAACGGGDSGAPPAPVDVYRSLGSVQCNGGGTTLGALQGQLVNAGVQVLAASCGIDGLAHVTVCGAPDGAIGIFTIPQPLVTAAVAAGFEALSALPNAQKVPCH